MKDERGPYGAVAALVKKVEQLLAELGFEWVFDDQNLDYSARVYFKGGQIYGKVIVKAKQTGKAEAQVVWLKKLPSWVSQEFFWKNFGREG